MALKSPISTRFVILSEAKDLVLSKVETLHGARPEGDSSVVTLLQNDSKRRVQGHKKK
jgi:hypothetical protein